MKEGTIIPPFSLQDSEGNQVAIEDFRGKSVILYFYPKDDTPGCTTQACDLRDSTPQIEKHNTVIIGISPDSVESHDQFKKKYSLPFILLSDPEKKVATLFEVYREKNMYGKKVMGIDRSTFLIDERGILKKALRGVKATGHVARLLEEVAAGG